MKASVRSIDESDLEATYLSCQNRSSELCLGSCQSHRTWDSQVAVVVVAAAAAAAQKLPWSDRTLGAQVKRGRKERAIREITHLRPGRIQVSDQRLIHWVDPAVDLPSLSRT